MIPIHELLSRIRWDKTFGRGRFELGFYDRCDDTVHRVALRKIAFPIDLRRVFEMVDEAGELHRIPFHRVREVLHNGQLIWQRLPTKAQKGEG